MASDDRKTALISELASARHRLTHHTRELQTDLNVAQHTREAIVRHRFTWLGGATLLGLLLAKIPARKQKVIVHRAPGSIVSAKQAGAAGLLLGALKFLFDLVRPMLTTWATKRIADSVNQASQNGRRV